MEVGTFRHELGTWLDQHAPALAPAYEGVGSVEEQVTQLRRVQQALFDAGWMQWGWPESAGGKGGSPLLRAALGEAVTDRDLVKPGYLSMNEILGPTLIDFAPPEVAATFVPRLLRGDETWCQGFSEPGSGSDLGSLSCRAVADGDRFVVNGQKVWTSLAQFAERCVLLTRTGTPESRHRGITAFFVDMDDPGITVRPLEIMTGDEEFSEVFFDDVVVPADRMIGELNGGWAVAMSILPYERSTSFWYRLAFLRNRLEALAGEVAAGEPDHHAESLLGDAFASYYAMRARARHTLSRLNAGETLGPETSVDKVLMASADQHIFDVARALLPSDTIALADDPGAFRWRDDYLYSRAATIYGGTGEIQRNIIARRVLDLGEEG